MSNKNCDSRYEAHARQRYKYNVAVTLTNVCCTSRAARHGTFNMALEIVWEEPASVTSVGHTEKCAYGCGA